MFLGLDLGTSGLRGLLVDSDQYSLGVAECPVPTQRPAPGWSEQSPDDWIKACRQVIADLRQTAPRAMAGLKGIGISGHMHGAVVLDASDTPVRPCIMWNDTRSVVEAAALDAMDGVRAASGNIVFPGFTAPKLAWMATHEPDLFARITRVVLPKDYLNFWLTGERMSEMSDASGTAWLDVARRDWSDKLLDASGMTRGQMPDLFEGTVAIGTIRNDLADDLGLPRGITVAGGAADNAAADNAAAACGIGALSDGQGFVSLGTSGVVLAASKHCAPSPETAVHTFAHAVPDRWFQMGVTLSATDSLNWLAGITGQRPDALTGALGDVPAKPGNIWFLPYLSGERTPHNDGAIRGAFLGLGVGTSTQDLTRAVLEGVAYSLRDSLDALNAAGTTLTQAIALGGGSASHYWVRLLTSTLNMPLDLPAQGEFGAALGAARLAICATTGAAPEQVMTRPDIGQTIEPDPDLTAACEQAQATYKTLYPGIKALTS